MASSADMPPHGSRAPERYSAYDDLSCVRDGQSHARDSFGVERLTHDTSLASFTAVLAFFVQTDVHTVLTTTFPGIPPLPEDDEIMDALSDLMVAPDLSAQVRRIGIVGPDGQIYRLLLLHGPAKYAEARWRLLLKLNEVPPHACMDAVMRKK